MIQKHPFSARENYKLHFEKDRGSVKQRGGAADAVGYMEGNAHVKQKNRR